MSNWTAKAPSNIALIKYMGKKSGEIQKPMNSSLSFTLNNLLSKVEIEEVDSGSDVWMPFDELSFKVTLSENGQNRFMKHWSFLKNKFSLNGSYIVRSGNNFPSDCGLASSASSFAALTQCAYKVFLDKENSRDWNVHELADLSRVGSGSSCRSFFSPWSIWDDNGASQVDLPYSDLKHCVVVVDAKVKKVSSSEAHKKVVTSALMNGRGDRANKRLENLVTALESGDWKNAYEITWAEFWDMHALFETSHPCFGYMQKDTLMALNIIRNYWMEQEDGPLVTMDAGSNIHLLFRADQQNAMDLIKQQLLPLRVL